MADNTLTKLQSALGVTAAFSLGSIVTTAALALLFSNGEYAALADWFHVGFRLLSYALFFGLTVDAIRFIARSLWPKTTKFAPSLADIVNIELS